MNEYKPENYPILIDVDGDGRLARKFKFSENHQVYNSCSVIFKGDAFIYGGSSTTQDNKANRRQISKVKGCTLEQAGTLPFDFYYGGCAVDGNNQIYLCFPWVDEDLCRASHNPTAGFQEIEKSKFCHDRTRVAASNSKFSFIDHPW